jgi:hypothetical protein
LITDYILHLLAQSQTLIYLPALFSVIPEMRNLRH